MQQKQNIYQLMSILLEAKECPEEEKIDDPLHQELNTFDPSSNSQELVEYDEERFQQLLISLRSHEWKLTSVHRKEAVQLLQNHQQAFNLKEEPLGKTPN